MKKSKSIEQGEKKITNSFFFFGSKYTTNNKIPATKLTKEKNLDKTVQILKKAQVKKINRQHNKSHNKINLTSHQQIVKAPKIDQIKHSQPDHKTMEIVAIKMLVQDKIHKNKIVTIKILKAQKRINKKEHKNFCKVHLVTIPKNRFKVTSVSHDLFILIFINSS